MRAIVLAKLFFSEKAIAFFLCFAFFCGFVSNKASAYTITEFPAQNLCATAFPTAWVSGTFTLAETAVGEFATGNNKTFQVDVPAGWAYDNAGHTPTVISTGTDITAISVTYTSATRIKVTISVGSILDLNSFTVTCQLRATAAGASLFMKRNGGNFRVSGSIKKPTSAESFGDLYAQAAMTFTSCTAVQTNTATVSTNTIDNDIIQVQVVVSGTCNTFNVTQLDFNTTGSTNPAGDITTAKLYYTGTVGTFSPSGLFGTYSSPSGAFSITGSQVLSAGTNYFWLTYDVPTSATVNNLLDATCSSVVMDGGVGAKTPTTTAPAGTRKIYVLIDYYSIATGVWNDNNNWSYTSGGGTCTCQPNGSGNVFIDAGHTITLDASRTVDFLTIRNGATLQDNGSSTLTVNNNFNTIGTGKIAASSNVTVSGFATFNGTGASTTTADFTMAQAATFAAGTSLTANGTAGNDIIIQGNLFLDGTLSSGSSGATIIMNGAAAQSIDASVGSSIGGTGDLVFSTTAKTISSISTLSVNPNIAISGAITITNNGTVNLMGSLTGTAGGSTWVNSANSVLNFLGASLLTTGTLTSTAAPNTINYGVAGNQSVKGTTYYNLILSTSGTKTFGGNVSVSNELTLSGSAIGDVGTNTLSGAGALTMSGTSELKIALAGTTEPQLTGAYGLTGGTITFNQAGAAVQTVNGTPVYYNLKLDGGNVASNYDLTAVSDVANDFEIAGQSLMNNKNGVMLIGGSFIHNTTNTTTLQNDITVRGNWTNNAGTLNVNGKVITFDGSAAAQTVGGTQTTNFSSLVLSNTYATAPQFVFSVNTNVTSLLTMTSGIVNLSGTTLTLGTAGVASTLTRTASSTTNWFYGGTFTRNWLNATAITSTSGNYYGLFPVGESTASSYSPLEISSGAGPGANGTFSVLYTPVPNMGIDLSPVCADGGSNIDRVVQSSFATSYTGLTSGTFDIYATMTGIPNTGVLSDVHIAQYTGGSTAIVVGTHSAATGTLINPRVGRTGVALANLNGDFRLATVNKGATPLPVEFLSLDATPYGNVVNVYWTTAVEMNSDYFMVQHSKDGIVFEDIAQVKASGNSSTVKLYSSVDPDPYDGISYYRLKQVDNDGKYGFSDIVAVNMNANTQLTVFPNPSNGLFSVGLSGTCGDKIRIVVRDILGKEFYSETTVLSGGKEIIAINPSGKLAPGLYTIISSSDDTTREQMIIIR